MTANLVAFLKARLDEDAKAAQGAWPGPWAVDEEEYGVVDPETGTEIADVIVCSTRQQQATSRHIIRHDPARVLADVDAKRRIIAAHAAVVLRGGPGARYFDTTTVCRSCEPPQFPEHAFPCATLRLLALPYADHPDYQPEWARE
ncbi:DUF6221 family protein [Kitasatospora sp. NPDC002551]|uniref:DUF6221 family protein n=1 Tax=Kitasatospora sp. NPDC002551 TaxID=3154539 RepID=UPI00331F87E9